VKYSNIESFEKAKNYAFLLLKFRLRSEKELYQRLKRKKFDEGIIRETLFFLKEKGFINDEVFAKSWIESRIKRPLGLQRVRQELRLKGIDKETIDSQISEIKKNYPEEEIVSQIAKVRLSKLKNIDARVAKRRVYAYLLRRGFSLEVVTEVINQR
jgi:regulatory protein